MRLSAAVILCVAALVAAAGCASKPEPPPPEPARPRLSRVSLVQEGMSPAQVRDVLGEPGLVEHPEDRPGAQIWHYRLGVVVFQDERVAFRHAAPAGD